MQNPFEGINAEQLSKLHLDCWINLKDTDFGANGIDFEKLKNAVKTEQAGYDKLRTNLVRAIELGKIPQTEVLDKFTSDIVASLKFTANSVVKIKPETIKSAEENLKAETKAAIRIALTNEANGHTKFIESLCKEYDDALKIRTAFGFTDKDKLKKTCFLKLKNPFLSKTVTDYVITESSNGSDTFKFGPALFDGFTADDWTTDLAIKLPETILKEKGENIKFFCSRLKKEFFTGDNAALVTEDCLASLKSPTDFAEVLTVKNVKETVDKGGKLNLLDGVKVKNLLLSETKKEKVGEVCEGYDNLSEAQAEVQEIMFLECLNKIKNGAKGVALKSVKLSVLKLLRSNHIDGTTDWKNLTFDELKDNLLEVKCANDQDACFTEHVCSVIRKSENQNSFDDNVKPRIGELCSKLTGIGNSGATTVFGVNLALTTALLHFLY